MSESILQELEVEVEYFTKCDFNALRNRNKCLTANNKVKKILNVKLK